MRHLLLITVTLSVLVGCTTGKTDDSSVILEEIEPSDSLSETSDRLVMALFNDQTDYELAVLPFDNSGNPDAQEFSLLLQDELISAVFRNNLQNVVLFERTNLNRIIDEQQLSLSGIIEDPVEVGKLVSASDVLIGHIQIFGERIRITAKIIDVETGGIVNSVSDSMELSQAVKTVEAVEAVEKGIPDGEYIVNRLEFVIDYSVPKDKATKLLVMKDGLWTEYNSRGDLVVIGHFVMTDERTIDVTWTDSYVESMIGNTTVYEYSFSDGVYTFKFSGGGTLIGFLEMTRK